MHVVLFGFMVALGIFFTIMSKITDNALFRVVAGSIWIVTGVLLITQGLSIPSGEIVQVFT